MTLLAVVVAVATLILLVSVLRLQPFLSFIIATLVAALLLGLPLTRIPTSIAHGVGDMLGSLAVLLCLGAMFGNVLAESGAAGRIAATLVALVGERQIPWAMGAAGLLVGIPLFYNVGFVLMTPLIFSVAFRTKSPVVYLAIPMLAGLSIAHGFLPPHPSPIALVKQFGADMGLTLIYGLMVGVPTLVIAGPLFAMTLKGMQASPSAPTAPQASPTADRAPGNLASFGCALLPVALLAGATGVLALPGLGAGLRSAVGFLGDPMIVMLVSLLVATVWLALARGQRLAAIGDSQVAAVRSISGILLIIAGAGALKQVFIDGGADAVLAGSLGHLPLPPLVLGWGLAMVIRIALGSATIAGLTAASLLQPLVAAHGVNPNLMVLAIGAGSLMCSHVNDSGFWMFKEYFGLSLRDTFRSWSLMETLVGVFGLIFILLLNLWV